MGNRDRVRHTPKKAPKQNSKERRRAKHLKEQSARQPFLAQISK